MTNPYPTDWSYETRQGCSKRCKHPAKRLERREVAPARVTIRHVWPVDGAGGLAEVLTQAEKSFRTGVVGGGSTWYAVTPRLGGTTEDVKVEARAFGSSRRQALQNLADTLGLKYGARCGR
jgi:hypothetical protein